MDFPVRKGLDEPIKVQGMYTNYFAIYCAILAGLVIITVGVLMNAVSGEGSFLGFLLTLVISGVLAIVSRVYFISRSSVKKFKKFRKTVFIISNKDLLHSL